MDGVKKYLVESDIENIIYYTKFVVTISSFYEDKVDISHVQSPPHPPFPSNSKIRRTKACISPQLSQAFPSVSISPSVKILFPSKQSYRC